MQVALAVMVLSMPAAVVILARWVLRTRQNVWRYISLIVVSAVWALATYFWIDYAQQQTDVGLMVQGILAFAVTGSAILATAGFVLTARF